MFHVDLPPSLARQRVALALLPTPQHCIADGLLSRVDKKAPGEKHQGCLVALFTVLKL